MEITKTIIKWFDETQRGIAERSSTDKSFTLSFCAIILPIMKTYCCATGLLVDKGFSLPTSALLRAISEFFIKSLWCLNSKDENELKERTHRWEKSTAEKKLQLLKNLLESKDVLNTKELEKLKDEKTKTEKDLASNLYKGMPPVTGNGSLFEQNSNVFGTDVSAILYSQFCSSVHVDTSILRGLMKWEGSGLVISDDLGENLGDVRTRCLNFAYMFLMVVYKKLGLIIQPMENEYNHIMEALSPR